MTEHLTAETVLRQLQPMRPAWEGLHSFNQVWDATILEAVEPPLNEESNDEITVSARAGVNQRCTRLLTTCNPVNFGKAQLSAIQGIMANDGVDPWEFISQWRSPFPNLFLDFANANGQPSEINIGRNDGLALTLYGACITSNEREGLSVVPFGASVIQDGSEKHQLVTDEEDGYGSGPSSNGALHTATPFDGRVEPMLAFMENPMQGIRDFGFSLPLAYLRTLVHETDGRIWPMLANAPEDATLILGSHLLAKQTLTTLANEMDTNNDVAFPMPFRKLSDETQQFALKDAWILLFQIQSVFDALYFLDAHNVTLAAAQVSRQVRRKAQREGTPIAQTVRVAATQVRRDRKPGKGGTANYSHRFERKGYTRHVTKGSHAKADLMKPCYRRDPKTNEPTCPDGCRREWVPPTIVGDENLPFVPKTRIVPGPNATN